MSLKWPAVIEQALSQCHGLFSGPDDSFGQPGNAGSPVREWPAQSVTRPGVASPACPVAIPLDSSSAVGALAGTMIVGMGHRPSLLLGPGVLPGRQRSG
jgi:hypothetical protein